MPAGAPLGDHEDVGRLRSRLLAGRVRVWFLVAAVLGSVHAGFSLYWSAGGTVLVSSLGTALVECFQGHEWLLAPVGVVKLVAALAPLELARRRWPARAATRSVCWLGAFVLVAWGGVNTAIGNLVLAGVIKPNGGFDRTGMIGHAYLWDPLFLAWGTAVVLGLLSARAMRRNIEHSTTAVLGLSEVPDARRYRHLRPDRAGTRTAVSRR